MILKERNDFLSENVMAAAGQNHEKDVAFYLRREFSSSSDVFVFNDIRISHQGEQAQIDHLILNPKGFLIIESKSITGEVRVNKHGEWSRSYNGQWRGMASPLRQAELQTDLLRNWLNENRESFFEKIRFFGGTIGVKGYDWQVLCAVSSNAILHRGDMTEDISEKIVKAEFIAVKAKELFSNNVIVNAITSTPLYSQKALKQLSGFILSSQKASEKSVEILQEGRPETEAKVVAKADYEANSQPTKRPVAGISCRKCSMSDSLTGAAGKFGYYVKCGHCQTNTPMKSNCPSCNSSSTKVSKSKNAYNLICEACNFTSVVM